MSNCNVRGLFHSYKQLLLLKFTQPYKNYAQKSDAGGGGLMGGALKKKKSGVKLGPVIEKKVLPVETDPERLVSYVCGSNIYKTGEDIKLKPDSEYPEWLWSVRTGPPPPLEEMDPESKAYWKRVRKLGMRQRSAMQSLKRF